MLLLLHLTVAFCGLIGATYAVVKPHKTVIRLSTALMILTVVSGTAMVMRQHLPLASACISGLMYVVPVSIMLTIGKMRLARVPVISSTTNKK